MLRLFFKDETACNIQRKIFEKSFANFKKIVKHESGQICLVIVNDKEIHKLNLKYRRKNKPTDVLSFAYNEKRFKGEKNDNIGDIFISIDTSKVQAKERGHSLNKELNVLFVHGLLHLFGFDHRNDKEEKIMESLANKIL